ncbi:hypothetical protein PACTADRAFT_50108 [Pachysolen tannophilus NRRL Y-2460]|uniref:Uncharacterized protein n=1 Tax=Pachysolen tannophilus NRRL Y-2460 TaxID=669874 RepID=A0A1E4TUP2_PACTA|nr:hypothetical protein PACTADRAFT_50108 [Pachysolen tannophilus NRRL Y-2460]
MERSFTKQNLNALQSLILQRSHESTCLKKLLIGNKSCKCYNLSSEEFRINYLLLNDSNIKLGDKEIQSQNDNNNDDDDNKNKDTYHKSVKVDNSIDVSKLAENLKEKNDLKIHQRDEHGISILFDSNDSSLLALDNNQHHNHNHKHEHEPHVSIPMIKNTNNSRLKIKNRTPHIRSKTNNSFKTSCSKKSMLVKDLKFPKLSKLNRR